MGLMIGDRHYKAGDFKYRISHPWNEGKDIDHSAWPIEATNMKPGSSVGFQVPKGVNQDDIRAAVTKLFPDKSRKVRFHGQWCQIIRGEAL